MGEESESAKLPPAVAKRLSELVSPGDNDPNELIKYRFLCRGAGLLLVGPTGVGKSAFAMQAMILWSLGRDAFGFKPTKPLKSLLVQAENDDGDLAEMRDGVMRGLNLSEEERRQVGEMVLVVREDVRFGFAFVQETLRPLLEQHRPDVLWIDPALSYLGGDASSQKDVGNFLRNMLNPILREFACGCVVLHHTSKPTSKPQKSDWQAGDFAYLGSGSIEWANWARGVVVLRGIGSYSVYELRAAKRGQRLGWRAEDGNPTFTKLIAHSDQPGVICWREVGPEDKIDAQRVKRRTTKDDLLPHVPADKPIRKNTLLEKARAASIGLNSARSFLSELVDDGVLHLWYVKRPRTNPEVFVARRPQPVEGL